MTTRLRANLYTAAGLLALLAASMTLLLIAGAKPTSAYEGPFCAEQMQREFTGCESASRPSIRRAVGHTEDGYAIVIVQTSQEALGGGCYTIECTANTGYLEKDGTGHAVIYNEGPNGTRRVDGYLYP